MNDKVNEQLADLLAFVKAGAEKTAEFAVEQAPLVAREIVAWEFWSSTATIAIATAVLVAIAIAARRLWATASEQTKSDGEVVVMFWVVVAVVAMFPVVAILTNVPTVIKATVAPRLVIIDYIGKLTK